MTKSSIPKKQNFTMLMILEENNIMQKFNISMSIHSSANKKIIYIRVRKLE